MPEIYHDVNIPRKNIQLILRCETWHLNQQQYIYLFIMCTHTNYIIHRLVPAYVKYTELINILPCETEVTAVCEKIIKSLKDVILIR